MTGETPTDFLGAALKEGDHVVWGVGGRRTHGLRQGHIVSLLLLNGRWWLRVKGVGSPGGEKRAERVCKVTQ